MEIGHIPRNYGRELIVNALTYSTFLACRAENPCNGREGHVTRGNQETRGIFMAPTYSYALLDLSKLEQ